MTSSPKSSSNVTSSTTEEPTLSIRKSGNHIFVSPTTTREGKNGKEYVVKLSSKKPFQAIAKEINAHISFLPVGSGGKNMSFSVDGQNGQAEKEEPAPGKGGYKLRVNDHDTFCSDNDGEPCDDDELNPDHPPFPVIIDVE